jgi:hypothetical protein
VADNHGSVVQRTVFEKDVFDEALVYIGIDSFSTSDDFVEGEVLLDDHQGACLALAHAHASHDDRHNVGTLYLFLLVIFKEAKKVPPAFMGAYCYQKLADVILKKDYQGQNSYAYQLVENGT